MTRSRLIWLQVAEQHYVDLPDDLRSLIDRRLAALVEGPAADGVYDQRSDQWSVPVGAQGLLFYAVVREPATVIVLRLVSV